MSITSSPEQMELETPHPPPLLSEDVAAEWPIEEDPDIILGEFSYSHPDFSEQVQVERDQTRSKILSLTSEDQLSIGENIRPHPAHSEEVLFSQTISIKSQTPVSLPSNAPSLSPLTSPRRAFSSLPSQQHKDILSHIEATETVKINSLYKTSPFLNSNTDPLQHHTDTGCEQNSETTPTNLNTCLDTYNVVNRTGEPDTDHLEVVQAETPVDTACKRLPSPVLTNGTQHDVASEGSSQLKDSFKAHSLDTPPLSSTTPEDPISDPFSSISSDTHTHCLASQSTQLLEKEGESESECSQVEDKTKGNPLEQTQVENSNYQLETPPNDATDQLLPPSHQNLQTMDICSSPCEFHDCEQDLAISNVSPSHHPPESQVEFSTGEDLTLVTEIETFSTIPPDNHKDEDIAANDTPSLLIPPSLRYLIHSPLQNVTDALHFKKCEGVICMQHTLRQRARQLKEAIAQMEEKILIQQSITLCSVTPDKLQSLRSNPDPLTHSHLLKLNHARVSEKQARSLKSSLKNCRDRLQTGFETESSSDDECYLNSTNLGGPKRTRLTKLYRNWLGDRAEIGWRWNWLDLRVTQIDNEISYVNQRLEEIQSAHSSREEPLTLETSSRCTPYIPSTPSRVIHQSGRLRYRSLDNILQSTPHHHSILSLPDDIPSTLLMYDSTIKLSNKALPLDPKDMKRLELSVSQNKSPATHSRYKAIKGKSKKIGHRPKLNSQTQSSKYRHLSSAEMSHKPGKSKLLPHGVTRQRRARSYDTTSIIIPGSYLPKPDKPTFKEIVIPGWRSAEAVCTQVDADAMDPEDTTDNSYEVMHSKCEELEIRNYQDAVHYSTSSKKLKRHHANVETQKISSSSYGWRCRKFPLFSQDLIDVETSHLSKPTDSNSPIEDAVFSTPHTTSYSYKSQQ